MYMGNLYYGFHVSKNFNRKRQRNCRGGGVLDSYVSHLLVQVILVMCQALSQVLGTVSVE